MGLRRAVALAQALTMILLLAPGPVSIGPYRALGAIAPAEPPPALVFAATGKGIGCQAGTRRFKGPKLPKDPPWPPGTKPAPTPDPSPSADPAAGGLEQAPSPLPLDDEVATGDGRRILLAASGVRTAQLDDDESATEPVGSPSPVPPTVDDPDLEPDVETPRETRRQGRRSGLIKGIDVSHHNDEIDYDKVRDAGNRFVFIKATQDNAFLDPRFPINLAEARAAGLAVGAYHFFDYTLDGRVQADHFLDRVEAFGGLDDALPPVVDVECWGPIGSSVHVLSETRLRDFVERVYERTARLPIVYTSVFMWQQVMGNASGFEQLPMWAACWGCELPPSLAPGWDEWSFWQTGVGRIPGVGRLDANFFSGSEEDLGSLRLRSLELAAGAAATNQDLVEIDLGGRFATHVRTSPDGESWSAWGRVRSLPTASLAPEEGEQIVYVQLRAGPGLTSGVFSDTILVDLTPPELDGLSIGLAEGPMGAAIDAAVPDTPTPDGVPVAVSWSARDTLAGLADAHVELVCGEAASVGRDVPGYEEPEAVASWRATTWLEPARRCDLIVTSRDVAGNETKGRVPGVETGVVELEGGEDEVRGAEVEASQVGLIARRGPDAGSALVALDGEPLAEVDLRAEEPGSPEVVFVVELGPGPQRVTVESVGREAGGESSSASPIVGLATLQTVPAATGAPSPSPAVQPSPVPSPSAAAEGGPSAAPSGSVSSAAPVAASSAPAESGPPAADASAVVPAATSPAPSQADA